MSTSGYWKETAGKMLLVWGEGNMTYELIAGDVLIEELMLFAASMVKID